MMRNASLAGALAAATALVSIGGGCLTVGSAPPGTALQPRDLTPVTWQKARPHRPVEIVRDGVARAVVYVVDPKGREPFVSKRRGDRPPVFRQLIDQLVETVRIASGATLELVGEPPAADRPAIVIGDCDETREAGIDASKIPAEGFVVKTAPNRVYLVGSTGSGNGTAWAVADFLERFVGVRWYWPTQYGGRSVERSASLIVPPAHYSDQPVCRHREMYQDWYWLQPRSYDDHVLRMAPGAGAEGLDTLWMGDHFRLMRQGNSRPYNTVQQGARVFEFAHKIPRDNEVIFAVNADGTRNYEVFCLSAPETLAFYLDGLGRVWGDGKPRLGWTGFVRPESATIWTPQDMGGRSQGAACHCSACVKTLAEGGEGLLMGRFVQRLCEEVKRRWPDKTVIYVPWAFSACPEELEFPGNLVVSSLNLYTMGLMHQPGLRREQEGILRRWGGRSGRPVSMWIDFASPSDWTYGPVQFPHVVQDFYLKNRDVLDGGLVLSYGGACFVTAAPTYYVWNRVLWNPNLDVDATLDEMCRRLFGPGAADARELMRLECDRWQHTPLSRPLRIAEQRIPPKLFREIWPADVVVRMKALRSRALAAIESAGDTQAARAFLYWTWTFDAFVEYAETVNGTTAGDVAGEGTAVDAPEEPAVQQAPARTDADARFLGGPAETNLISISNVRRTDGADEGTSDVRFDLSWGHTWRAAWVEPGAGNVTGADLKIENWSAAWVFAKYRLPGREKEGYSHATLSVQTGDHRVPQIEGGLTLDVGLTDGKGKGVFIYRAGAGHGPLNLSDVRLRWMHGADGVTDPAAAELRVFALEMVYVPRGAFKVGSGGRETGSFTDGVWTDGASRPFLVDAGWSGPRESGPAARRIGNEPGRLWGIGADWTSTIGPEGALAAGYPTGFEPFYCMRYEVTRGQFTAFLNTLSDEAFASTFYGDTSHAGATYTPAGRYDLSGTRPNLVAARPDQACNLLGWWDCARFAAWAGLRPMSELEYEKACRGPRKPVPDEFAWGTTGIAVTEYAVTEEGRSDERVSNAGAGGTGNANYDLTMPAYYGGPTRGGVSAVPGSPMRAGIFATATSGRVGAGASYWGILDLSGNVREHVVGVAEAQGRIFEGTHGDGSLDVPADWPHADYSAKGGAESEKDDGQGSGLRGGFFGDLPSALRVSDRSRAVYVARGASFSKGARTEENGFRVVRTAPGAIRGARPDGAAAVPVVRTAGMVRRLAQIVGADGRLDEWGVGDGTGQALPRPSLTRRDVQFIFPADRRRTLGGRAYWEGPADFGVRAWWGWDGEALCVAAEVSDDRHFNSATTNSMIWNGDAMQIGVLNAENVHWDFGLALTAAGAVFHQFEGKADAPVPAETHAVVRDEAGTTRYELRMPVAGLGLKPGEPFGFNVVFFDDDDGKGQQYRFELGPGLTSPQQPELFQKYVLE